MRIKVILLLCLILNTSLVLGDPRNRQQRFNSNDERYLNQYTHFLLNTIETLNRSESNLSCGEREERAQLIDWLVNKLPTDPITQGRNYVLDKDSIKKFLYRKKIKGGALIDVCDEFINPEYVDRILENAFTKKGYHIVMNLHNNKINGFMIIDSYKEGPENLQVSEIKLICTAKDTKFIGTELVELLETQKVVSTDLIRLSSVSRATGFWERLMFKRVQNQEKLALYEKKLKKK